jgi:hypothetical protein
LAAVHQLGDTKNHSPRPIFTHFLLSSQIVIAANKRTGAGGPREAVRDFSARVVFCTECSAAACLACVRVDGERPPGFQWQCQSCLDGRLVEALQF